MDTNTPDDLKATIRDAVLEALSHQSGQFHIRQAVFSCLWEMSTDINYWLHVDSTRRSAEFVLKNIPMHLGKDLSAIRRDAIQAAPVGGLCLEFGTWKGNWIRAFAAWFPERRFFGFDSFEGLPGPWSTHDPEFFNLGGVLPEVPENVTLVKGWFDKTLPSFLDKHLGPVSFIHMDCDLYASTMTVLDLLHPRLRVGTQIVLDDFLVSPGWESEEKKAFEDFTARERIKYDFTGWTKVSPACAVSVVLTEVPPY